MGSVGLCVGLDVGPLHGRRTGIGNAVAWVLDELEDRPGLDIVPYVTSARARPTRPQRRLPLPAALAHRLWARTAAWPVDRLLGHPDVVHGTNYVVPPTRCPSVVSVYDCWFLEHPERAGADVRRAGAVLRRAVDAGATVLTSSFATSAQVRRLIGAERVRTVHLGPPVGPEGARNASPECRGRAAAELADRVGRRPFVLALGTVEHRKNHVTLVDAFARLAADDGSVLLVIAGAAGDAAPALGRRLAALAPGVAERVVRVADVDHELKTWLLHHATVLAYPSLDEGFGFPVLEAQQAGTPVVGSDAGSIGEIAGDGALLGAPDDIDALAANLHTVLHDREAQRTLVERGAANLGRFSWRATGDAYVALYAELAGDGR